MNSIFTFDGGADHLLPARWIARTDVALELYGYGITEEAAIEDLLQRLYTKYPNILWYQNLPVKRIR